MGIPFSNRKRMIIITHYWNYPILKYEGNYVLLTITGSLSSSPPSLLIITEGLSTLLGGTSWITKYHCYQIMLIKLLNIPDSRVGWTLSTERKSINQYAYDLEFWLINTHNPAYPLINHILPSRSHSMPSSGNPFGKSCSVR